MKKVLAPLAVMHDHVEHVRHLGHSMSYMWLWAYVIHDVGYVM
jgi:hypothetical protein